MISFLSPIFLLGAAAVSVPILLHLLKREPEATVKFPAVKLIRRAPVEYARRRRLREPLLLALRMLAVMLLALAFARPFVSAGAGSDAQGVTMIALDTSLSLAAPGQFDRARELAREAVDRVPGNRLVGVVTFAEHAAVVALPSGDRALARAAINAASPGWEGTDYRSAIGAATEAIGARAVASTIVVVSDLQEGGWDQGDRISVPQSTEIELLDVGVPPPNIGIVAARATGNAVVATVHNWGPAPRQTRVALTVDEERVAESDILVEPGESVELALPGGRGIVAVVAVEDPVGLAADNTRFVALEAQSPPAVIVITATGDLTRDAFYLEQALRSSSDAALDVRGVAASAVAPELAGEANPSAVVLVSSRGLDTNGRQALRQYMQSGGGLLVAAGPELDDRIAADVLDWSLRLEGQVEAPRGGQAAPRSLTPGDVRHPIFRGFGAAAAALGLVTFERIATVIGEACPVVARFTTGEAALVDCPIGDGRAFVLASDLDGRWNDFPLHATFVPFVHEVVQYLGSPDRRTSDYLVDRAPSGVRATPGVVQVPGDNGAPRWVAVNVDPSESNPSRLSVTEFKAALTRVSDGDHSTRRAGDRELEERQGVWRYLLVLMGALLVVESVVAVRSS